MTGDKIAQERLVSVELTTSEVLALLAEAMDTQERAVLRAVAVLAHALSVAATDAAGEVAPLVEAAPVEVKPKRGRPSGSRTRKPRAAAEQADPVCLPRKHFELAQTVIPGAEAVPGGAK